MQSVFLFDPASVPYTLSDYLSPLDLASLFPGRAELPLEIDLGCGDGGFLVKMAATEPDRNFIGVERLLGRVRVTSRRTARAGLANVRLLRVESHYMLRHLLLPESVSRMHLMFPDPWPKRRHWPRRLVQTEFLDAVCTVMKPGGELRLTTDDLPYFTHMRKVFTPHPGFNEEPWEPGAEYPQTDFEAMFRAKCLPIYRALLKKA